MTNHVGEVDMVVNLGNGAKPYNYSDMTGFNERVVNPDLKPLKGYWAVIHDCGLTGEVWENVSWNAIATNGSTVEVLVRASNDRLTLAKEVFMAVTNGMAFEQQVRGRYLEVRLSMARYDASRHPVVYDLTLHGASSGFNSGAGLDDTYAYETQNAVFTPNLTGPGLSYQWFRLYPWETNWVQVAGATNGSFTLTNVDSFVDWAMASCLVSNSTGERLWLGPAQLAVVPLTIHLPSSGSIGQAERYPATIHVFGQPTNLATVTVTLRSLSHARSADLAVLLVSPTGTNIMLMSKAGGTNGASNVTLIYSQQLQSLPPESSAIPSNQSSGNLPSNYEGVSNLPGAPSGQYSTNLYELVGTDPNGTWKLYIYDYRQGGLGQLQDTWQLNFTFQ